MVLNRAPAVVVPVSCIIYYHCPVWTKTSSVTGLGKRILKQPGNYCFAQVTPLSLMGSLLQMTSWEQAVKLCRSWRQRLLSAGPAPQSQAVREKDAEGSGSLVQISLLFFSWDIPWHGLRMRRWVGMIYSGCPSVLEMEETTWNLPDSGLREKEVLKNAPEDIRQWLRRILVTGKKN